MFYNKFIDKTKKAAIWNGAIGFGLVNIPIKMYSATESSTLDLDMLDKNDQSNIHYKRVNELGRKFFGTISLKVIK